MLDASMGRLALILGFKEKLVHFAHGQALGQIVEGAMLGAAVMTVALGFAAGGKALDDRSAKNVGGNAQLLEEKAFALAQCQCGFAGMVEYPSHVYG